MAKRIFGMDRRDLVHRLKEAGCSITKHAVSGHDIWKTPRGTLFRIPSDGKVIPSQDAMMMNQALRAEGVPEIHQERHKKKVRPEAPLELPPPPPRVLGPVPLRTIFYQRLIAAKRRLRTAS